MPRYYEYLHHPNLVSVFDVGTIGDELVYIVMERLVGQTLRSVLDQQQQLSPVEALSIGEKVAEGLAFSHVQRVIHRDLKPENVFLTSSNDIKVLNTGITSFIVPTGMTTERDWVRGTLLYMSPEHIQGFGVTARSDIYSLGTLLYECLAGNHPVLIGAEQLSLDDVALRQIAQMPPPLDELLPEVPDHVARIIQQMLAKEAVLRFGTMDEVAIRLRESRSRLLAESGNGEFHTLEQRPYIVFPSPALGMRAAAVPSECPATHIVAAAERRASAATAQPAVTPKTNRTARRRGLVTAISLGALAGIAVALWRSGSSKPEIAADSSRKPTLGTQPRQPGYPEVPKGSPSVVGQAALAPTDGTNWSTASLCEAKNINKSNSYDAGSLRDSASERPHARLVINPIMSEPKAPKASPSALVPSKLVF